MIAGRSELMNRLRPPHAYIGTFLPTTQCVMLLRGLRTLDLRMSRHTENGTTFAAALRNAPDVVSEVNYGTNPDSKIQGYFPRGFGGMVSIRFARRVNVKKLMERTTLVTNAPSLGGTESNATMPSYSTNWFMSPEEKSKYRIDDQLVRFSIGLEQASDLVADVINAARSSS